MKILKEYWEAALKLHTSRPSSFLILLAGLMFAIPVFDAGDLRTKAANALLVIFVVYLYVDMLRLEVQTQRDLLQKFIDSLDN